MALALRAVGTVLDAIAAVFHAAIALLLFAMLTINAINIVSRSFLGHAIDWVFHWSILMFAWMACLGFYVYIRRNRDVVVELISGRLPPMLRRLLAIAADGIGLIFMFMILSPAAGFLALQVGNMEAIPLPIWVQSVPLFVTAAGLTAHFAVHALQVATGAINPVEASRAQDARDGGAPE